jgi:ADP-heptose:LPS heptosyltransferase
MKAPRRILLVKPSSLGDVIHSLPVVSELHRHFPESELRWLIHPAWRSLVEGHPGVSGTILFPREKFRGPAGWIRSLAWLRTLRDWTPDLAIDLQGLLRSALFARVSGARRIVGLSDAREGARLLLGEKAPVRRNDHAVRRYLAVLDLLGIPQPASPEFVLPQGTLPEGFGKSVPFVVLHPFARGEGKSLALPLIRAFAKGVAPARLVVLGRGSLAEDLPANVEDWTNRTDLLGLTAILRGASFVVSSDSGPMHLAAALHPSRTLAVHLWSDPLKVGPCFPESMVWKNGQVARVAEMDDSFRAEGRPPSEAEMEALGRMAAEVMKKDE